MRLGREWIRKSLAGALAACLMLSVWGAGAVQGADGVTEDGLEYYIVKGEVTITGFDPWTRTRTEIRRAAEAEEAASRAAEEAAREAEEAAARAAEEDAAGMTQEAGPAGMMDSSGESLGYGPWSDAGANETETGYGPGESGTVMPTVPSWPGTSQTGTSSETAGGSDTMHVPVASGYGPGGVAGTVTTSSTGPGGVTGTVTTSSTGPWSTPGSSMPGISYGPGSIGPGGNRVSRKGPWEMIIPETIDGCPVTTIGDWAFKGYNLSTVYIPGCVRLIGRCAFRECKRLETVTFGEREEELTLRAGVFQGCIGLTELQLPDGITSLPKECFAECSGLVTVQIPGSVKEIGEKAFADTGLTEVSLPAGVERLGDRAFAGTEIQEMRLGREIQRIGAEAFPKEILLLIRGENTAAQNEAEGRFAYMAYDTDGVRMVLHRYATLEDTIPVPDLIDGMTVTKTDEDAFDPEKRLTPDVSGTSAELLSRDGYVIYLPLYPDMALQRTRRTEEAEAELTLVRYEGKGEAETVPYGVTGIWSGAFEGAEGLKALRVPETVNWIERGALTDASELKDLYLANPMTDIEEGALPEGVRLWRGEE